MPPGSMQYTLVGFSAELDWRPLHFVKPIPPHSVCGACGLVRKRSAFLPCSHTLCESCYEQSARDGVHVCPLDGRHFDVEDVFLKEFTVGDLLRREVKCWNEGSDCGAVLPASQIGQHFRRECRHHSIRCPKCSARVLCTDVCAHLASECGTTTATPAGLECQGNSGRKEETALLTSSMQSLEEQAGELKALMERLLVATGANGDRLNEVVHGVNSCQEALREVRLGISNVKDSVGKEEVQARREHRASFKKCSDEIAALFTCNETLREELRLGITNVKDTVRQEVVQVGTELRDELAKVATEKRDRHSKVAGGAEGVTGQTGGRSSAMGHMDKAVPKQPHLHASVCEFVVKGVGSLKEKARKEGRADYESERVYLRGYCISPSVCFQCSALYGSICLNAQFRLHQGDMDDVVRWPFRQRIKLRVVHPKTGEEEESVGVVNYLHPSCQRPQEGRAQDSPWTTAGFNLHDLISDGYVENDQLRLKFELLP
ncbi:uncharacterized protein LOC144105322 isoform X2 [Amblyomma americanum]